MSAYGEPQSGMGTGDFAMMAGWMGLGTLEGWMGPGKGFVQRSSIWATASASSPYGRAVAQQFVAESQALASNPRGLWGRAMKASRGNSKKASPIYHKLKALAQSFVPSIGEATILSGEASHVNPYYYKNYMSGNKVPKAGFWERKWPSTIGGREELAKRVAFRSWRGNVFSQALSEAGSGKGLGAGFKSARGVIAREMGKAGIEASAWNMSKLVGSHVARGASLALNAYFVADIALSAIGGIASTLVELGRPRDATPRFYDSPFNATMRQAGLQAIHESRLQTRSAFSREASFLHR